MLLTGETIAKEKGISPFIPKTLWFLCAISQPLYGVLSPLGNQMQSLITGRVHCDERRDEEEERERRKEKMSAKRDMKTRLPRQCICCCKSEREREREGERERERERDSFMIQKQLVGQVPVADIEWLESLAVRFFQVHSRLKKNCSQV